MAARREMIEPDAWTGRDVVILGGGPSLSYVDVRALNDAAGRGDIELVATNGRAYGCPQATAISYDLGFLRSAGRVSNPLRVYLRKEGSEELFRGWRPITVRRGKDVHWPTDFDGGLVAAGNTGIGAIAFADVMCGGEGAIYLAGFDLYDPHANQVMSDHYDDWRHALEAYRPDIRTPLFIATPSSLSEAFPRRALPMFYRVAS